MTLQNSIEGVTGSFSGRPLTGWKVLSILLAFFGTVGAVNGALVYFALTTFRGEVENHAYDRGLAYNREIANAREQAARDWNVDVSFARQPTSETLFSVLARDAQGAEISGVKMTIALASPADTKNDVSLALSETSPGRYEGHVTIGSGWRNIILVATRGDATVFRSRNRVRIE